MVSQVILSSKGLVADITCIWSFVGVGSFVDEQVVRFGEMPATKLANKFLFCLRRQPSSRRFSVRRQFVYLRNRAPEASSQLRNVPRFRRVLLGGRYGKVGKVKARPVFVQGRDNVSYSALLRMEEVRGKRQYRQRKTRIHEALGTCHFCDGWPQSLHVRVGQSPVVHVHGLYSTETVKSLQLIDCRGKGINSLEEGVVGELKRRVERDRRWQRFTSHFRLRRRTSCWNVLTVPG